MEQTSLKPAPKNLPARYAKTNAYAKRPTVLQARSRAVHAMVRRLIREMPWLERSDRYALVAWAEFEYICAAISVALNAKGGSIFNADGSVKRLAHDYRIFRQSQSVYARECGLTPLARKMLGASSTGAALDLVGQLAANQQSERAALKRAKPAIDVGENNA